MGIHFRTNSLKENNVNVKIAWIERFGMSFRVSNVEKCKRMISIFQIKSLLLCIYQLQSAIKAIKLELYHGTQKKRNKFWMNEFVRNYCCGLPVLIFSTCDGIYRLCTPVIVFILYASRALQGVLWTGP